MVWNTAAVFYWASYALAVLLPRDPGLRCLRIYNGSMFFFVRLWCQLHVKMKLFKNNPIHSLVIQMLHQVRNIYKTCYDPQKTAKLCVSIFSIRRIQIIIMTSQMIFFYINLSSARCNKTSTQKNFHQCIFCCETNCNVPSFLSTYFY